MDQKVDYNSFADEFSHTRYSIWKGVREFLQSLPAHTLVGDIGTGNGKNLRYRKDLVYIGNDISDKLIETAKQLSNTSCDYFVANGLSLPLIDNAFDNTISIAVLHHIFPSHLREQFIYELIRVTAPGGRILITVWADTKSIPLLWKDEGNKDYLVPWNHKYWRRYHLFNKHELEKLFLIANISYKITWEMDNYYIECIKFNVKV